jgi:hypothetical protein
MRPHYDGMGGWAAWLPPPDWAGPSRRCPSATCARPSRTTASGSGSTRRTLHLWGASDEGWRASSDLRDRPVRSGAESFLAGTASCRIEVADVDALFTELAPAGVLHPTSREVGATDFGTREFAAVDLDGNLLSFFC